MSRPFSRQECFRQGISWDLFAPDIETFKKNLILRNEYTEEDFTYVYKILHNKLFDKVFRFTSINRCSSEISMKIEVIMKMIEQFNLRDGTDYRVFKTKSSTASYEEAEELDIDDLETTSDLDEKRGNRESGYKSEDESYNFSINEIINREKRIHDYITKEIYPLFSARTLQFRKETEQW